MGQKNKSRLRKCIACQNMMEKKELIRVVKDSDGVISIDRSGKANGRGAYICRNAACIENACKRSALSRSLRCEIAREIYDELKKELGVE